MIFRCALAITAAVLWGASTAAAQGEVGEPAWPGPLRPTYQWSLNVGVTGIYDSEILNSRAESGPAVGVEPFAIVGYSSKSLPGLEYGYRIAGHRYTETDRWNRVSHYGRIAYERRLNPEWEVELAATASLRVITLEYAQADQYMIRPRIEYQPDPENRYRLYGAYRFRQYRDEDRTQAHNPYVWLQYRRRLARGHYGYANLRYERNDAELDRRDYGRSRAAVQYGGRVGDLNRVRAELEWFREDFARADAVGGEEVGRLEHRWRPSVGWTRYLNDKARLEVDYRFQNRTSTLPSREFNEHLVETTIRVGW